MTVIIYFVLHVPSLKSLAEPMGTYVVATSIHLILLIVFFTLIIGGLYWFLRKQRLVTWMSIIHAIFTILPFLFLVIVIQSNIFMSEYKKVVLSTTIFIPCIAIILLGQIMFIINIIISVVRKVIF